MGNNFNSLSNRFNRMLLFAFVIAPFAAYISYSFLKMDFLVTMGLLSYFGIILILFYSGKKNKIRFPLYLLFYLLFVGYTFFSTFYILDRDFEMKFLITNKELVAFNFMFIIENVTISKNDFKLWLRISKKILLIAIVVILYQQAVDPVFFEIPTLVDANVNIIREKARLQSIYSWITWYSNGFGFVPLFLIVVELLDRKEKKILPWILFGMLYAILTKTRWVMVNTLMVFAFLFINHKNKLDRFFKYILIIPLIVGSSYLVLEASGIDIKGIVLNRILEKDKKVAGSGAGTRLLAVHLFNKLYWKNAVFGVGNVKYGMASKAKKDINDRALETALRGRSSQLHVGYLMLFYVYGLIGGILFLSFIFVLLRKLYKESKITTYWAPFLGILGFALANISFVTFSMLEMGLLVALAVHKFYVTNKNQVNQIHA